MSGDSSNLHLDELRGKSRLDHDGNRAGWGASGAAGRDLAEALRAFGYDLPTALADLVDNSIAAGARTVKIDYSSDPGAAWLAVVDDGRGMDAAALRRAMRFARDPGEQRAVGDLGRFGLGLKTASLSQARRLTVLSRGRRRHPGRHDLGSGPCQAAPGNGS